MSNPYLGEIRYVSFNLAPRGWALCNGQTLQINQNQPLFALLGTTYGGDGIRTFALPDLRGRVPVHQGTGVAGTLATIGERAGEESVTLTVGQLAAHAHSLSATTAKANLTLPGSDIWASDAVGHPYGANSDGPAMDSSCTTAVGGSQPHDNRPPILTLNAIIALQGIFPPRS